MKKRTTKPYYDKTCQHMEAKAQAAIASGIGTVRERLIIADGWRKGVVDRLKRKRASS